MNERILARLERNAAGSRSTGTAPATYPGPSLADMIFTIRDCTIDTDTYEVRRAGKPVPVEPQVFDVLVTLLENSDRLVTRDEIIERVWNGRIVSESALSSRIKAARQVIGDDGSAQNFIRTVRGRGFRIVADVTRSEGESSVTAGQVAGGGAISLVRLGLPEIDKFNMALPEGRTSLVVLPFRLLGDWSGREFLRDGLVDEVTSALARVKSFFVIARGTAQAFAGKDMDVRDIASILGVRYVVWGTIRAAGDALRVSVHLTDAIAREEVWSAAFDGELSDSFDVQDRVTEAIAGALQPSILVAEVRRLQRHRPDSMTAYELVFRAMPKCWARDQAACADATALLERAVELDPNYALALALLSWCHGQQVVYNWLEHAEDHRREALEIARRASAIDSSDPLVLTVLANAETTAGNIEAAAAHVHHALEIDPNFAWGWNRSGFLNCYRAKFDEAMNDFHRALRLSPLDPMRSHTYVGIAHIHFFERRYDEAVAYVEKCLLENPETISANRILAAASAMAGDEAKASRCVRIVEGYAPWVRVDDVTGVVAHWNEELREYYRGALLRAGFKS